MPGFAQFRELLQWAVAARARQVVLEIGDAGTKVRHRIDGVWQPAKRPVAVREKLKRVEKWQESAPITPEATTAMMEAVKTLCLPAKKSGKSSRSGKFNATVDRKQLPGRIALESTPAGKRMVIELEQPDQTFPTLAALGMEDAVAAKVAGALVLQNGLVVVSAPPGEGLTTTFTQVVLATDRLLREFRVEANVGKPQVAYRETILREATGEGRFVRQAGGKGQYGHVVLKVAPGSRGSGLAFSNSAPVTAIPPQFVASVSQGVEGAYQSGALAGYAMVDVAVELTGGSFSETDSSDLAFKIAGSMAFRDASGRAHPVLLEPVMAVEVVVPEEFVGDVIGDLNSRRGEIRNMGVRGIAQVVDAQVPLVKMFGYSTDLRSFTQGRATYSMQFSHFSPVSEGAGQASRAHGG
jgi:hypothetical protein